MVVQHPQEKELCVLVSTDFMEVCVVFTLHSACFSKLYLSPLFGVLLAPILLLEAEELGHLGLESPR